MKRALVISGGGSKGAFAGGIADYLIGECGLHYDIFVGTSTGSLLVTHLALGKCDKLKQVFTHVTQDDIFNIHPFIITKDGEEYKSRMNHWDIFRMFLKQKKTFGESENLRNLIRTTITKQDFDELVALDKQVVVTVSNLTRQRVEYKYAKDCNYEDYCDWVWASANIVPFMSLLDKNGYEYADGGFGNLVPIQEAISAGARELDVIVLKTRHRQVELPHSSNPFMTLVRTQDFMLHQIGRDDIFIGHLEAMYSDVKIRFFYTPYRLTDNSFIFDPTQMSQWWEDGWNYAKESCKDPEATS